jgi:hypothetical protein
VYLAALSAGLSVGRALLSLVGYSPNAQRVLDDVATPIIIVEYRIGRKFKNLAMILHNKKKAGTW